MASPSKQMKEMSKHLARQLSLSPVSSGHVSNAENNCESESEPSTVQLGISILPNLYDSSSQGTASNDKVR